MCNDCKKDNTLASELLKEVKASAKRWFIAFCIMVGLEIATVIGFMWYITLPTEETTITQDVEDIDDSDIKQIVGDDYGESKTEGNSEEKSNEK